MTCNIVLCQVRHVLVGRYGHFHITNNAKTTHATQKRVTTGLVVEAQKNGRRFGGTHVAPTKFVRAGAFCFFTD